MEFLAACFRVVKVVLKPSASKQNERTRDLKVLAVRYAELSKVIALAIQIEKEPKQKDFNRIVEDMFDAEIHKKYKEQVVCTLILGEKICTLQKKTEQTRKNCQQ